MLVAAIKAVGPTPLDFLLSKVWDENCDEAVRIDCAKAAAPYVHARLNAIEAKVTHRDEMSLAELRKAIAADLAAVGVEGAALAGFDGEGEAGAEGRPN